MKISIGPVTGRTGYRIRIETWGRRGAGAAGTSIEIGAFDVPMPGLPDLLARPETEAPELILRTGAEGGNAGTLAGERGMGLDDPMTIEEEATLILDLVGSNSLKTEKSPGPIPRRRLFAGEADEDGVLDVLRSHQVNLVAIAPGRREIRIGLEQDPAPEQHIALPSETAARYAITYHRIKEPVAGRLSGPTDVISKQTPYRGRYPCGSLVKLAGGGYGTFGAIVEKDGVLYGLTNNHVTGGCSFTEPGTPVLGQRAASYSGGLPGSFTVGYNSHCATWVTASPQNVPIEGNLDIALFRIADPERVSLRQGPHFDTPAEVATVADILGSPGAPIWKVGGASGLTRGRVYGHNAGTVSILMKDRHFKSRVFFKRTLSIESAGRGPFIRRGDSGSLVVWRKDGRYQAVGIVFIGTNSGKMALVLPMEEILSRLRVRLIGRRHA